MIAAVPSRDGGLQRTSNHESTQLRTVTARIGPRAIAFSLAGIAALALACDLLWMPIQVADSLGEILDAQQSPSVIASFTDNLRTPGYLRPLRIAQIKLLFDLSAGQHYWIVFRGFHALLMIAAVVLFVRALRVSSAVDAAAAAFALATLVGLHTFRGMVAEAFPINHFLEIAVLCLVTLNLAQSRGDRWIDAAASAVFITAALTLESGVLVWVVAMAAWVAGWRGISGRGLGVMTALLLTYGYLRFAYLSAGVPTLDERSSGFLLEMLDPDALQQRFGANPTVFYAYNVAASVMSVLFAEPNSGVFETGRAWRDSAIVVRAIAPVVISTMTTGLLAWTAARRLRTGTLDDSARFILVFVAVLLANAIVSFAYTKDETISAAGVFYALAAFAACREGLIAVSRLRLASGTAMVLVLGLLATGWSFRTAGVHFALRSQAAKHQLDWLGVARGSDDTLHAAPRERLVRQLQDEVLAVEFPNPRAGPGWPMRLWVD
jgi:hypothetical protein